MQTNDYSFSSAIPVWEEGTQQTMNRTIAFIARIGKRNACLLAVSGASSFIVLVNGKLIAHGPARAAHGFFRVDEYQIAEYLTGSENIVEIRVSGYNINSFAYLDQPSFLCAEIVSDKDVLAYTGVPCKGFSVFGVNEKMMKVHRFSYQRPFTENYRLGEDSFDYSNRSEIHLETCGEKHFIYRDLPYGEYAKIYPEAILGKGNIRYSEKSEYYEDRSITKISEQYRGYKQDELEFKSYVEVGKMDFTQSSKCSDDASLIRLDEDTYADIDMGVDHTGLVSLEVEADDDCEIYITFDEILVDGKVDCFRLETSAIISLILKKGSHSIVSAEPYAMRYIRIAAKGGSAVLKNFSLIEIAFPKSLIKARFTSNDASMRKIYDAAIETFRANVVDIYMDCPSRERSGYLCDSFFTSRVENILTGASTVERQHLANFIMPDQLPALPRGMLPMCYPADVVNGLFIPNWAMWYVLELEEYFARTNDRSLVADAKQQIYAMLEYFEGFENEYGLLERLKGWVFVEWSRCNDLVQDVSFPTNMLYSKFLNCIAELYDDNSVRKKSKRVKDAVNDLAMTDSGFYCDNAIRSNDGKLSISGECTETCQYYAFFCDVATPDTHPELWETLVEDFGSSRNSADKYEEIHASAPFIGNYLRLDLLLRYRHHEKLYSDIKGYFGYMAQRTGTLWEHAGVQASCNHGFASHVIYWMKALKIVD